MGRLLQVTARYARTNSALRLQPSSRRAVAATLAELEHAVDLPAVEDFEALRIPVGVAWTRQARASAYWVLYTFDAGTVTLHELRDSRPVEVGD